MVGDVAYFGISVWAVRRARADGGLHSEVAAFHIPQRRLLWRERVRGPELDVGKTCFSVQQKCTECSLSVQMVIVWQSFNARSD